MADTRENKSELEAMEEFAKQMWERYFKPKASEELLGHSLDGYKATVKTNNGDGTLTVTRPFDCCEQTLRCPPGLSETAQPGDQVLAVNLGDASNSFVLCKTDLSGLGGGGSGYRPISYDFSTIDSGFFTEVVSSPASNITTIYDVTRDELQRITKITNTTDGWETAVRW